MIKTYSRSDELTDILHDISTISNTSWQGRQESGLFSNASNALFYRNLISHSLEQGYGKVYVLYYANSPAAYEYHIVHRNIEYCLKAEYAQQYCDVSPGAVLEIELVKQAFASGIEIYDLLGSADSYKLRWTHNLRSYSSYYVFTHSLLAHCAHLFRFRARRTLKKIKRRGSNDSSSIKDSNATR